MKNFIVTTTLLEEGHEAQNPDFRAFEHYFYALKYFYYLVGVHSSYLSNCSCRVFSPDDSSCLNAICVSNGSLSYYIYIYHQKNS